MSACCGHPPARRAGGREKPERLPPNPSIRGGALLMYLGAGRRDLRGAATALKYVVSSRRRAFRAHEDDVRALLRQRDIILHP